MSAWKKKKTTGFARNSTEVVEVVDVAEEKPVNCCEGENFIISSEAILQSIVKLHACPSSCMRISNPPFVFRCSRFRKVSTIFQTGEGILSVNKPEYYIPIFALNEFPDSMHGY